MNIQMIPRPGRFARRVAPALMFAGIVAAAFPTAGAHAQAEWPGPKPDGSTLLTNGWRLWPHGRQIPLASDLPVRLVMHPSGRWFVVQHAGFRAHRVVVFSTATESEVSAVVIPKSWSGAAFSRTGDRLYVSGGVDDVIHVIPFDAENGALGEATSFPVGRDDVIDLPAGMTVAPNGHLWIPLQRTDRLVEFGPDRKVRRTLPLPEGSFPFECVAIGKRLFVSLWAKREVRVFDTESGDILAAIAAGDHPSEMAVSPDEKRLFVSNGNENTVTVIDVASGRAEETIGSALYPNAPPGSTPNSVAVAPNGKVLLIANADNNNCAVIDISERGESRSLGFIPLGWYPTSIRFAADGGRVFVANGKGSAGSRKNPGGPAPRAKGETDPPRNLAEYTGAMFTGSLTAFEFPKPAVLQALSKRAYRCSPLRSDAGVRGLASRPADSPIPARLGDPSPIRHCVYIIKENRTYDQVLGDDPRGNGDPTICLFPERVTPNHHAIAKDFVLLDNFYVESEVSADGHEWTVGAYATDFVERTWPVTYGGKGSAQQADESTKALGYPSEGNFPVAFPKSRYLWDRAREAGVSYRSYGEFVRNAKEPDQPGTVTMPSLAGHFDPWFRSYDMAYRDVKRAERFLTELRAFESKGTLPRLMIVRLPNDHTVGSRAGRRTPRACVADNDLALGMVLEGLSKSRFWKSMAVFVVEDDAQNGPDHVDAHRTVAFVAGPYVKRGAVVSTMYSTCGMLRTIELILGLQPMSQFDAAARPMYDCFTSKPDLAPYRCRDATWDLEERNAKDAPGAKRSAMMNLDREDAADDIELNEIIWKTIRGRASRMPPPRRAAFVRVVERD